ncbi:MAG: CPBP family intramembrane glutamic endopeptidase [Hellea sp.]
MSAHYDYFKQALAGESRWWSWIMVFWFVILGWLMVQGVISLPLLLSLQFSDPELFNQLVEMSMASAAEKNGTISDSYASIFQMSTVLGILFWILNRFGTGTLKQVSGGLTGLTVGCSILMMILLAPSVFGDTESTELMSAMMASGPFAYITFLLVFPASLIALYLGQKFIHKRSLLSLHTAAKKIRWSRGLQAFIITWIVLGSLTAVGHFSGLSPITTNFDAGRFAIYAVISLIFLPLQSGTEEIVFRGYLNQWFSHFLKNKWIAFVITSALFAAMHLSNPEATKGAEDGILLLTMSSYFIFGFVACLMVWMDEGLESAIGFHAANNTFAAIFVNYEGSVLPTPSLFMATPNTVIDVPTTLLATLLIAAILYKTRKPLSVA